ncbi:DUF1871 family protein [Paenibacillus sp. GSMTC-2017]|uniref:DUF1871 family protein n=1 Tax=Paenibacillus sp. GSMTC-2017 TaxID=2794350 RepID=UPI0018D9B2A5|nr:DUF1871 family protein [Paenibacillus sp. GSMTC-2017]MBH5317208.1 DUF1871 family protein [Paenibacillus sp. GSMTC-2017]
MNISYDKVEDVINKWDPINLFPLFPPDEYKKEIDFIANFTKKSNDTKEIANYIYVIFTEHFGETVFDKDRDECLTIANSLLE